MRQPFNSIVTVDLSSTLPILRTFVSMNPLQMIIIEYSAFIDSSFTFRGQNTFVSTPLIPIRIIRID